MSYQGISVVIPNYNGACLFADVLPSLYTALSNTGEVFEIIVSDDCSSDDSVAYLEKNFPDIIILKNTINLGFSPTINKGVFAARYDYLLLLNSDVKLTPGYFESLFRYFEREDTFGVMGRIVGWNDEKMQDGAKYPSFHGAKIKTAGNYYAINPQKDDWLFSTYLSGANAFVDRKKIVSLGGFDEIFAPFYVEDYELSLRAWRLGWKCYYDHFAVCRHQVSVSIKSRSSKRFINTIYYRNKMFLHYIHLSGLQLANWYLQMILEALLNLVTGRLYFIKSLQLFLKNRHRASVSKKRLKDRSVNTRGLLTVKEVFDIILLSVKNKKISRF